MARRAEYQARSVGLPKKTEAPWSTPGDQRYDDAIVVAKASIHGELKEQLAPVLTRSPARPLLETIIKKIGASCGR